MVIILFLPLLLSADNPFISSKVGRPVGRLAPSVLKAAGEKDVDKEKDRSGAGAGAGEKEDKDTNIALKKRNPFLKQTAAGDSIRSAVKTKESVDEYDGDLVEF